MLKLSTPKAGGPHVITLKGKNKVELKNVLSGDVWLCSGQSNMEWTLHMTKDSQKDIKTADYQHIRYYKANKTQSKKPLDENIGHWKI